MLRVSMRHGYHYATIFIKQGANLQNSASKKRVAMANLHERLHLLNTKKERLTKPGKMLTWNNYSLFSIDIITHCFTRTMVNCTRNISHFFFCIMLARFYPHSHLHASCSLPEQQHDAPSILCYSSQLICIHRQCRCLAIRISNRNTRKHPFFY